MTPRIVLLKLLSRLPLPILLGFSRPLYFILYYLIGIRKNIVYGNLGRAFPEKSQRDIQVIAKRFYRNYSQLLIEIVKALSIKPKALQRRVRFLNSEMLDEPLKRGQPVILMIAHYCNLEWLLLAGCLHFDYPVDVVYKPLKDRAADRLVVELRSRFGGRPIAAKHTARELRRRRNVTRILAIVADQRPHPRDENVNLPFLNQTTTFILGVDKLAAMTQYPVLFMAMRRTGRGYYEVSLKQLSALAYSTESHVITHRYAEEVESLIHEEPADWLWSHRRWKHL